MKTISVKWTHNHVIRGRQVMNRNRETYTIAWTESGRLYILVNSNTGLAWTYDSGDDLVNMLNRNEFLPVDPTILASMEKTVVWEESDIRVGRKVQTNFSYEMTIGRAILQDNWSLFDSQHHFTTPRSKTELVEILNKQGFRPVEE